MCSRPPSSLILHLLDTHCMAGALLGSGNVVLSERRYRGPAGAHMWLAGQQASRGVHILVLGPFDGPLTLWV